MAKKNTRKRSDEEQALWDQIEALRKSKAEMVATMNSTVEALLRFTGNESDLDLASAARTCIAWRVERDKVQARLSAAQEAYDRLRSADD